MSDEVDRVIAQRTSLYRRVKELEAEQIHHARVKAENTSLHARVMELGTALQRSDHTLAETRGLSKDLTTVLEKRNNELRLLKADRDQLQQRLTEQTARADAGYEAYQSTDNELGKLQAELAARWVEVRKAMDAIQEAVDSEHWRIAVRNCATILDRFAEGGEPRR